MLKRGEGVSAFVEEKFLIRIEPYGKEVVATPGETVLEILRREFYGREGQPSFQGCRRGGCAFCKMELLSGNVHHNEIYSRAALTTEERERNFILACQSKPLSNLTLRMLERESFLDLLLRASKKE
ncbi:Ferredoxin [[Clostridium] ultunense Esp]|nr:Ferredoxin [[Clostridium] ultunense Esp]